MSAKRKSQQQPLRWYSRRQLVEQSKAVDYKPYCRVGYMPPYQHPAYYFASAFRLTNETLNIWTHFLPLIYFIHKYISRFVDDGYQVEPYMLPFYTYGLAVCLALLSSTVAHMFNSYSAAVHHCCFSADKSCIFSLVFAGISGVQHYICELEHHCAWPITLFSLRTHQILVVICFWWTLFSRGKKYAKVITAISGTIVSGVGISPCFVRLFYGMRPRMEHLSYYADFPSDFFLWAALVGLFGILLYGFKIPERFSPDTFAMVGNSHQLWHLLIAAMMYYHGEMNTLFVEEVKAKIENGLIPDSVLTTGLWKESLSEVFVITFLNLLGILVDWQIRKWNESKKHQ